MPSTKSPRQLALAEGRATYVSARHPCQRCGGRKRFTANGACKKCQETRVKAHRARQQEHAALLNVPASAVRMRPESDITGVPACCPTCKRPWPVEDE
jgi:hypothetical protein